MVIGWEKCVSNLPNIGTVMKEAVSKLLVKRLERV